MIDEFVLILLILSSCGSSAQSVSVECEEKNHTDDLNNFKPNSANLKLNKSLVVDLSSITKMKNLTLIEIDDIMMKENSSCFNLIEFNYNLSNLPKLYILRLTNNSQLAVFNSSLPKSITTLDLNFNKIKNLRRDLFTNKPDLRYLKLESNSLEKIDLDFTSERRNCDLDIFISNNFDLRTIKLRSNFSKSLRVTIGVLNLSILDIADFEYNSDRFKLADRFVQINATQQIEKFHFDERGSMCGFRIEFYTNRTINVLLSHIEGSCFNYTRQNFNQEGLLYFFKWNVTMSLYFSNNNLMELPNLSEITNLKGLFLGKNRITSLDNSKLLPESLEFFNVSENSISFIRTDFFRSLAQLKVVIFGSRYQLFSFMNVDLPIHAIEIIRLVDSRIISFVGFRQFLKECAILLQIQYSLHGRIEFFGSHLTVLNRTCDLNLLIFNVSNLKITDNNESKMIDLITLKIEKVDLGGKLINLSSLTHLETLNIIKSNLTELTNNSIILPANVTSLDFSRNKIYLISKDFFFSLINITNVRVSFNQLKQIDRLRFNPQTIPNIYFDNNPISSFYVGHQKPLLLTSYNVSALTYTYENNVVEIRFVIGEVRSFIRILREDTLAKYDVPPFSNQGSKNKLKVINNIFSMLVSNNRVSSNLLASHLVYIPFLTTFSIACFSLSHNRVTMLTEEWDSSQMINIDDIDIRLLFLDLKNFRSSNLVSPVINLETVTRENEFLNSSTLLTEEDYQNCKFILYFKTGMHYKLFLVDCYINFLKFNSNGWMKNRDGIEHDAKKKLDIDIHFDSMYLADDNLLFENLTALRNLTIQRCKLGSLTRLSMTLPPRLERLVLISNHIESIERGLFLGLTNLGFLDLTSSFTTSFWIDLYLGFLKYQKYSSGYLAYIRDYLGLKISCQVKMGHSLMSELVGTKIKLFKIVNSTVIFMTENISLNPDTTINTRIYINEISLKNFNIFNINNDYEFKHIEQLIDEMSRNFDSEKLNIRFLPSLAYVKYKMSYFNLDLSKKNLKFIPNLAEFDNKLINLDMSRNGLIRLDESERVTENIKGLNFSFNNISIVDEYFFSKLSNLKRLSLSHNLIETLEKLRFSSSHLEILDLSNNKIKEIGGFVFTSNQKFQSKMTISFENNQLRDFPEFEGSILGNQKYTDYVDMRNNLIEKEALCRLNLSKMPFARLDIFPQHSFFNCQQISNAKKTPFYSKSIINCMSLSKINCDLPNQKAHESTNHLAIILDLMIAFMCFYIFKLVYLNRYQPPQIDSRLNDGHSTSTTSTDGEEVDSCYDLKTRTHNSLELYRSAIKQSSAKRKV
jgi:Leucine-rich repeat (LRR) protein